MDRQGVCVFEHMCILVFRSMEYLICKNLFLCFQDYFIFLLNYFVFRHAYLLDVSHTAQDGGNAAVTIQVSPLGDTSLECREVTTVPGPHLSMCGRGLVVCGSTGVCSSWFSQVCKPIFPLGGQATPEWSRVQFQQGLLKEWRIAFLRKMGLHLGVCYLPWAWYPQKGG